jgi:gentisate 1,2-dioxygenase
MAARSPQSTPATRAAYHDRLQRHDLSPLWEFFHDWFQAEPHARAQPKLWNYGALRPLLLEAGELITTAEAERRVLVLANPGLSGRHLATDSLYAGLQVIMPGESARSHRHSAAALRFILEGSGAYTSVDGEKCYMEPGDFIITPGWTWHEHGHEGSAPTVWLDVLDVPLHQMLGTLFSEPYEQPTFPERVPPGDSLYRYGMNMLPVEPRRGSASPVFSYPYARARAVLEHLRAHSEWDPHHGLRMEYIDPTSGGAAIPTISTFLQLLPQSFTTARYQSTDATIFSVVEGRGTIMAGLEPAMTRFDYEPRDIFVIPSWIPYTIATQEESIIFRASDRVVQQKLGVWRERRN